HEDLRGSADVSDVRAARPDAAADLRDDAERRAARVADVDTELEPAPADHGADPAGAARAGARPAVRGDDARVRRAARVDRGSPLSPRSVAGLSLCQSPPLAVLRARSRSVDATLWQADRHERLERALPSFHAPGRTRRRRTR